MAPARMTAMTVRVCRRTAATAIRIIRGGHVAPMLTDAGVGEVMVRAGNIRDHSCQKQRQHQCCQARRAAQQGNQ
jgi:hypothetical protein